MKRKKYRYSDGYAEFKDGSRIYDRDLAAFVKKHLKFFDRFDCHKVVDATLLGFAMLEGGVEIPKKKNWKF